MIYLNNAATSWPKPEPTAADLQLFWKSSPELWKQKFDDSLKVICEFFGIKDPGRFIVTSGATAGLNLVFTDMEWEEGDIVVTGSFEHHALSGWELRLSQRYQVEFKRIESTENEIFDLDEFERFIKKNHKRVKLVAFTHASNVTGDLLPAKEIIAICRKYKVVSLLDAAQTAGIIELDIDRLKPDIFLFAGHKGTMGPHGIGGLYLSNDVELNIPNVAREYNPLSVDIEHNTTVAFPTYCDVGSINLEGMSALASSFKYLNSMGFDAINKIRNKLNTIVYDKLNAFEDVDIISKSKLERTYAIAFRCKNASVSEVHGKLTEAGCIIGSGFFCSPSAHVQLGTEKEGVLRISAGLFTTEDQIDKFFEVLEDILSEV